MNKPKLHTIRFKKGYKGSAEVVLNLPNGGRKRFNKLQKDKTAGDFPEVQCPLSAEDVLQYGRHGYECTPVVKKAKEKE